MPSAQVICVGVSYFGQVDATGPDGRPGKAPIRLRASRGDIIELDQTEFDRQAGLGAVRDPSDAPLFGPPTQTPFTVPAAEPGSPGVVASRLTPFTVGDPAGLAGDTDPELVAWIRDDKPTVGDVVDMAGDDAVQARRLLAAETAAHGEPRPGVRKGLGKVIDDDPSA